MATAVSRNRVRRAPAPRRAPDAKRQLILDAALDLFGRYGFRRTSIDDIARAAGIAKGTVYLYVETKEALFRSLSQALLDRVIADARRAAAGKGDIAARLLHVLDAKFGFFHDLLHRSPHASELLDSTNRVCADVFAAGDAEYVRVLTKALAEAARRGEIVPKRHGLDAGAVATLLVAGAHGIAGTPGAARSNDEFKKRLTALVTVVVAGLAP